MLRIDLLGVDHPGFPADLTMTSLEFTNFFFFLHCPLHVFLLNFALLPGIYHDILNSPMLKKESRHINDNINGDNFRDKRSNSRKLL